MRRRRNQMRALAGIDSEMFCREGALLLPGALLVAIGAQLLAPFMLIDLGFAAFL